MDRRTLLRRILGGSKNVAFADFDNLLNGFRFELKRMNGSHHIYGHPDLQELVNIQEVRGQVKPYQVRQFLKLVEKYNLRLED